jgi:hypothetical protein
MPPRDGVPQPPRSDSGEQPQPAFGPEPPRAHQAGPAFPDADTPTGARPANPDGWPSADHYYWYVQTPNGGYTTEAPPAGDYWRAQPTDPFGDSSGTEGIWDHPSANPPWAAASAPPPGPAAHGPAANPDPDEPPAPGPADDPPTGTGSATSNGHRPAADAASDGPAAEDELLPPAEGAAREPDQEHPTLTVRALQPATVYRQAIASTPHSAESAGSPPSSATAAAALCGLLAVPMLATAGALFGGVSGGAFQLLLPVVTLLMAAGCVVGGVRLISRGSPLLPLFIALVAAIAAASSLLRSGDGLTDMMLAGLWVVFLPLALIMVALLRSRRVRRWLIARSREWQASRPPSRRRRFRLPAIHIKLPKLPRRDPSRRPARKPTRVKQVGRHAPQRRSWLPWRRGPVSYVGRESPRDRDG